MTHKPFHGLVIYDLCLNLNDFIFSAPACHAGAIKKIIFTLFVSLKTKNSD